MSKRIECDCPYCPLKEDDVQVLVLVDLRTEEAKFCFADISEKYPNHLDHFLTLVLYARNNQSLKIGKSFVNVNAEYALKITHQSKDVFELQFNTLHFK